MRIRILGLLVIICVTSGMVAQHAYAGDTGGTINTGVDSGLSGVIKRAPTPVPPAGSYDNTQSIFLTATGSSAIYYTLDGTLPTSSSTKYNGSISITVTATIRCVAYYGDGLSGPQGSYSYVITQSGGGGGGGGGWFGGGGGGGPSTPIPPPAPEPTATPSAPVPQEKSLLVADPTDLHSVPV